LIELDDLFIANLLKHENIDQIARLIQNASTNEQSYILGALENNHAQSVIDKLKIEEKEEKEFLKKSIQGSTGSVILVADSDMLFDALSVGRDLFGRMTYRNHNIPFLENAVEQASGGGSLMTIRTRGSGRRPFTKFKELRADASAKLSAEIEKVTQREQELASEISKLIQEQDNEQMVVLGPEAANKIKALREQEVEASKTKRELSRELRKDIRKIENEIKNWNIAGVPALVVIIGIFHLMIRRRKISAR